MRVALLWVIIVNVVAAAWFGIEVKIKEDQYVKISNLQRPYKCELRVKGIEAVHIKQNRDTSIVVDFWNSTRNYWSMWFKNGGYGPDSSEYPLYVPARDDMEYKIIDNGTHFIVTEKGGSKIIIPSENPFRMTDVDYVRCNQPASQPISPLATCLSHQGQCAVFSSGFKCDLLVKGREAAHISHNEDTDIVIDFWDTPNDDWKKWFRDVGYGPGSSVYPLYVAARDGMEFNIIDNGTHITVTEKGGSIIIITSENPFRMTEVDNVRCTQDAMTIQQCNKCDQ